MKWVYTFREGNKDERDLLGGKGANLAEMTRLGLPVPPGFIISTAACNEYLRNGRQFPAGLGEQIEHAMHALEEETGHYFSHERNGRSPSTRWPLIVSVRSGAPISMPGMLETVLNVGLTFEKARRLERLSDDPNFIHASLRRLLLTYARVVYNLQLDEPRDGDDIQDLLGDFQVKTGKPFPQDPYEQLRRAVRAVFDSWISPKAREYRSTFGVAEDMGTAVVVQQMVFGNIGDRSGTGVAFSRNPTTGLPSLFAEYLPNAQGEDVVSGIRTPHKAEALEAELPGVYRELREISDQLEQVYRDMQDIEFTVERGRLFILQTRSAKRTPFAAVKCAVDMVREGMISKAEAVKRVDSSAIAHVLMPRLEDSRPERAIAQGIASSPGAAVGRIAIDRDQVNALASSAEPIILVQDSISPDDVPVMPLIAGIVTREGGATSHAAVVARGLGIPCVVGCGAVRISADHETLRIGREALAKGDYISIDGTSGLVFAGRQALIAADLSGFPELRTLLGWADELVGGQPAVCLNANTPAEVEHAFQSVAGAQAIGLCRTEWMYYDVPFRDLVREALIGQSLKSREDALQRLQQAQADRFDDLFTSAGGRMVTIRLLSAPLDDFMVTSDSLVTQLAELRLTDAHDARVGRIEQQLRAIHGQRQANPRFGTRGIRLLLARPAFMMAQLRAIFEGAARASARGVPVQFGILLPYIVDAAEVVEAKRAIEEVAASTHIRHGGRSRPTYQVGALIETPRAALTAAEIAPLVDFISFGTDGLTETTFAYARDDAGQFLPSYADRGIFPDPLRRFDLTGVGELMRLAVTRARERHPDLRISVSGVHAGASEAMPLYSELRVNSVSVDPSHALGVRFALAQAKASDLETAESGGADKRGAVARR